MELKVVYDNESKAGYKRDWGFSCLVDGRILFDMGTNPSILLYNMNMFDIQLERIETVIFSHEHGDHTGGYPVIRDLGEVDVYVLRSFSRGFKEMLSSMPNVNLNEIKGSAAINDNIYTTGELGFFIKEQSLLIKTGNGITVLTGCSHPGLDKILSVASKFGKVYAVIGGFHGFSKLEVLSDLDLIVPCHCTARKREILRRYPDKSLECYAGLELEV